MVSEVVLTPGADISTNRCSENSIVGNMYQSLLKPKRKFYKCIAKFKIKCKQST